MHARSAGAAGQHLSPLAVARPSLSPPQRTCRTTSYRQALYRFKAITSFLGVAARSEGASWDEQLEVLVTHDEKVNRKAAAYGELRSASYRKAVAGEASPRRAIAAFCVECCGYSLAEARRCRTTECALHPYMKRGG